MLGLSIPFIPSIPSFRPFVKFVQPIQVKRCHHEASVCPGKHASKYSVATSHLDGTKPNLFHPGPEMLPEASIHVRLSAHQIPRLSRSSGSHPGAGQQGYEDRPGESYEKVLSLAPEFSDALRRLSYVERELGQPSGARYN